MAQLQTVKDELGLLDDTADTLLLSHIVQASSMICTYTDRIFAQERVVETLDSLGGTKLQLTRRPIVTVHEVKFQDVVVDASSYSIYDADSGVLWRRDGWTSTEFYFQGVTSFPSGEGDLLWEVDYTAGYKMPGEVGATLPGDLERSCLDLAKSLYLGKNVDSAVVTRRIGSALEHRSADPESGLPTRIALLLRKYKTTWLS